MKNYFLFLFFLVISVSGYAQGKRITGKVTDAADGMPIIGATVVAVDPDGKTNAKSVGTITDINGMFTLNVPNGCQELKFSYVGMETKTAKITGLTHINVSLASTAKALDEVVVTALGVTRLLFPVRWRGLPLLLRERAMVVRVLSFAEQAH